MLAGCGRVRRSVAGLLLSLVLMLLIVVPGSQGEGVPIAEIRRAIAERGLDWWPAEYGRDFAHGTLLRHENRLPSEERPAVGGTSLAKASTLPTSLDWRQGDWISPITDQGQCGSCWAFSAVAALESLLTIEANTPGTFLDLSESIVAFCADMPWGLGGCSGGYMDYTAWHMTQEGTYTETCFPYILDGSGKLISSQECSSACQGWQDQAYTIGAYQPVAQSVVALKSALQNGPFEVAFNVYSDFYSYAGGVYERALGDPEGGHAVLLVGYQDTPGSYGGGYFIVKNSWGEGWGEDGFFRVGYSMVSDAVDFGTDAYLYLLTDPTDEYEPDGSWWRATTLEAGEPQAHSLFPSGDGDWYRFELEDPSWVAFATEGPADGDTVATLYTEAQAQIASDDDSGDGSYSRIEGDLAAGTYLVWVRGYDSYRILSTYTATLTIGQPEPTLFDPPEVWLNVSAYNRPSQNAWPRFVADVSGDGLADSVLFHQTLGIKVALGDGQQFNLDGWWSTYSIFDQTSQNEYPRFLADVNGDGKADAAISHPTKGIKVALSTGTRFVMDGWWSTAAAFKCSDQDRYPRVLADVNGDGKADAVVLHPTKGIKVALSNGQRFLAPVWWSQHAAFMRASQNTYPRLFGDVNGDGRADAVLFHPTDGVMVALSDGRKFGDPQQWHSEFQAASMNTMPRALGDVNGDGMADAVLFVPGQSVRIALSNGTSFGPLYTWAEGFGWGTQDAYPRSLVDCNGDGADDAVLFRPASGMRVALAHVQ